MSDINGNLIFYSNACDVFTADHEVMENGGDLNAGFYHDTDCDEFGGNLVWNGLLSLPWPGRSDQYMMLHLRKEPYYFDDGSDLLFTTIDMTANNGAGAVLEKNQLLLDNVKLAWSIQGVKHANGRDWWITVALANRNIIYSLLLDPWGLHGPFEQETGDPDLPWQSGEVEELTSTFTPDGARYIRTCSGVPALFALYDFDRCTGRFGNMQTFYAPDGSSYAPWPSVSRDSRYLYITDDATKLYQYDLQANSIDDSRLLVGEYDGFTDPLSNFSTSIFSPALAPNGKIYMSAANSVRFLHTIHEPELGGLECDFRQHDVVLPKVNDFYMPNLPNFRLYNLPGSACDSLELETPIQSYWRASQDAGACPLQRTFRDLSWHEPASWLWDFGDGATATEASPTHVYEAPGTYNVCLTVCKDNGDCHTSCREVVVSDSLGNTYLCGKRLLVYPNPAWDRLWVYYENMPQGAQFYIYDELGRLVATQALDAGSLAQPIDISILPQGFYAWQIVLNNNMPYSVGKLTVHR